MLGEVIRSLPILSSFGLKASSEIPHLEFPAFRRLSFLLKETQLAGRTAKPCLFAFSGSLF